MTSGSNIQVPKLCSRTSELFFALVLGLIGYSIVTPSNAADRPLTAEWRIQKVDRKTERIDDAWDHLKVTVLFTNGRSFDIPIERSEPIAVLRGSDGTPYLLASGADCTECDENITLRMFLLSEKGLKGSGKRYTYPGKLTDYQSPELLEVSRTFYGRCLSEPSDVVVWFMDYLGDDEKWHKLTTVARVSKDGDWIGEPNPGSVTLETVLARTKGGACIELLGVDGTIEP